MKNRIFCTLLLFFMNLCPGISGQESNPFLKTSVSHEYGWVTRYFDSVDGSTYVGEVVDFLCKLRGMMTSQGYDVPLLSEVFVTCLENVQHNLGLEVDELFTETLYEEIVFKRD